MYHITNVLHVAADLLDVAKEYRAKLAADNFIPFNDITRGKCVLCRKCGLATADGLPMKHQDKCEFTRIDAIIASAEPIVG